MKRKFALESRHLLLAGAAVVGLVVIAVVIMQFGPSSTGDKDSSAKDSKSSEESAPTPAVTDPGNQQAQPTAATTITISATGFSPSSITIARGTTLTWRNDDTSNHAVAPAAGSNDGPHSPQLAPKASFNYSFQKTGTFTYSDAFNPSHTGTVIVTEVDNHR